MSFFSPCYQQFWRSFIESFLAEPIKGQNRRDYNWKTILYLDHWRGNSLKKKSSHGSYFETWSAFPLPDHRTSNDCRRPSNFASEILNINFTYWTTKMCLNFLSKLAKIRNRTSITFPFENTFYRNLQSNLRDALFFFQIQLNKFLDTQVFLNSYKSQGLLSDSPVKW